MTRACIILGVVVTASLLSGLVGCQSSESDSGVDVMISPSDADEADTASADSDGAQGDTNFPIDTSRHDFSQASPEYCGSCHQQHYDDWKGSMHSYATTDPVFIAMQKKGIEETKGELGQFCIQCHAPVASKYGLTPVMEGDDGIHRMPMDMKDPMIGRGVVCVTCHTMSEVEATLNAQFKLDGSAIQGPTGSEAANEAHPTVKSEHLGESKMCGTCHNVVNPKGALLENTFSEWYASEYNSGDANHQGCQDCHMPEFQGEILPGRRKTIHRHRFVGVDVALVDDYPKKEEQRRLVEELLQNSAELEVIRTEDHEDAIALRVNVTNTNVGHALPSGSTADRQVWVHLVVENEAGEVVYESGMMDRRGDLMDRVEGHSLNPEGDPDLLAWGSFLFDEKGEHVNFPWQAKRSQDFLIQPGQTGWREYEVPKEKVSGQTIEVTATLRYRTFPPFLIRELEEEGYLEAGAIGEIPIVDMEEVRKRWEIQ